MRQIVAASIAMLLSACASMADRGTPAELFRASSASGETADAFVLRVAPAAIASSKAARAAACGELVGTGPYSVEFRTDHRADACSATSAGGELVLVNGIAEDARDAHFALDNRRAGYLITPWVVKHRDAAGVRIVGVPLDAQ